MARLYLNLPTDVSDALQRAAAIELRPVRLQAHLLLRDALVARGILPRGKGQHADAGDQRAGVA